MKLELNDFWKAVLIWLVGVLSCILLHEMVFTKHFEDYYSIYSVFWEYSKEPDGGSFFLIINFIVLVLIYFSILTLKKKWHIAFGILLLLILFPLIPFIDTSEWYF